MNGPTTYSEDTDSSLSTPYDVERIREDFPALQQKIQDRPLVYLDNAATSQKPEPMIEATSRFYDLDCANVHRGVHELSQRATKAYEDARESVRRFIGARDEREVIFTSGTTDAINLVAYSLGLSTFRPDDEIVITAMEHHANIVPWQMISGLTGAKLRVAPINDAGELIWTEFEALLGPKTKLVAFTHVSNALGTINPARKIIAAAHKVGALTLLDGAQSIPHMPIDVVDLDCDFFVFSAHKVYGPTGIGVLYGKMAILDQMPPFKGGGDMIASVSFEKTTYNRLPYKFEAGTPHIAGGIALGAALDYVRSIGIEKIRRHEDMLLRYATQRLQEIGGIRIIGTATEKAGVLSFLIGDIHPHDIGTILDQYGIAIRAGHHCAQPIMTRFGIPATARASFALYNTREEVDVLVEGITRVKEMFGHV